MARTSCKEHWVRNWPVITVAALLAATWSATGGARADSITEGGDAGYLPATAQWDYGTGALSLVTGSIDSASDADMFAIYISDPAAFSASTTGSTVFDTQLFLFDASGIGIAANDDILNGGGQYNPWSALPVGSIPNLTAGLYYIAISSWDYDPVNESGNIFTDDDTYNAVVFNMGPGGGSPVETWEGTGALNGALGAYQINLTGAEYARVNIPEGPTIAMLAIGAIAVLGKRAATGAQPRARRAGLLTSGHHPLRLSLARKRAW